ncbi:hypothetical protein BST81_12680 [Leptolyngbya sp. 'hensonii']|uniref:hypothetical protein n=1 Tax=Leptolyngbya sp. 'hensonii' TaxID=1922337 RepID=UPI000966268F|nr:hypothetical protein [Leptolyngbya sp. 'hensonii']OLP17908.1 hypothetical protein BST81_12680 [Leptolyngbya sp. 'hensonii']
MTTRSGNGTVPKKLINGQSLWPFFAMMAGGIALIGQPSAEAQPQTQYSRLVRANPDPTGLISPEKLMQPEFKVSSTTNMATNSLPTAPVHPGNHRYAQIPAVPIPTSSYTDPNNLYTTPYVTPYAGQYFVYIDSDSRTLLQQVRSTVEPTAFLKSYAGRQVIQAGSYNNFANVEQQIRTLQAQGFSGVGYGTVPNSTYDNFGVPSIPPVTSTTPYPTQVTTSPNTGITYTAPGSQVGILRPTIPYGATAYYVVIPGNPEQLSFLQQRVIGLGADLSAVQRRGAPRGPHIAVGPFSDRGSAETWSNYFRDNGLDARVYYGK